MRSQSQETVSSNQLPAKRRYNNMSIGVQFFYLWLIAAAAFIIWRVLTNPLAKIHRAVLDGNLEVVRRCLEQGVNPDLRQGQVIAPLGLAATKGHREIAELLIAYGADINQGLNEEDGVNPLLGAAIGNHTELVESLLSHGARTGIHLAALQGNIDAVRTFLGQQSFPINSKRNRGMTPLHLAAMSGHREVAELLLDSGADVNFYTPASETSLIQAVEFNRLEVADLLIDRGADMNRSIALYAATRRNYREMVELLIAKGVDVNYQESRVENALHTAAKEGYLQIAELLLANGAQVNAKTKVQGETPLHCAAEKGHLEMAELLIRYGADVNSTSGLLPTTPLDCARSFSRTEMMRLLQQHGAVGYGFLE
jgi:ankyrin repeat protein